MGRKSKEEIAKEERNQKLTEAHKLIRQLFSQGQTFDTEDVLDQLGFQICQDCQQVGYKLAECQVCSEYYCWECATEHASEETGL